MGGDDYVLLMNTKHTDAHKAAHDLNDQVSILKQAVIGLLMIYEEAADRADLSNSFKVDHKIMILAARNLVTPNV